MDSWQRTQLGKDIAARALQHIREPIDAAENATAIKVRAALYTVALLAAIPAYLLSESKELRVRLDTATDDKQDITLRFTAPVQMIPYMHGYPLVVLNNTKHSKLLDEVWAAVKARKEYDKKLSDLDDEIQRQLTRLSTANRIAKFWPEVMPIMKERGLIDIAPIDQPLEKLLAKFIAPPALPAPAAEGRRKLKTV